MLTNMRSNVVKISSHASSGGALLLANVTLIAPVLAGANSTAAFLPRTFVTYPSNSTVSNTTSPASLPAFALDSVTLILSDCGMLQDYQTLMCGLDIETDVPPWPGFEAEPGWMFLWNLNLYTPAAVNISYWRTLMTCSYPTPPLAVGLYQTVSPSNAPSAPPVIQDAAWNNTLMFTNPDGKIVDSGGNPVATLPALPVLGNSTDGVRPQQCAARRIADSQQLLRGVVELQTQSEGYVILQVGGVGKWSTSVGGTEAQGWGWGRATAHSRLGPQGHGVWGVFCTRAFGGGWQAGYFSVADNGLNSMPGMVPERLLWSLPPSLWLHSIACMSPAQNFLLAYVKAGRSVRAGLRQ
jgi:hypothetical protein